MTGDALEIRVAGPDDRAGVLELLARTLHWRLDDTFERFFEWKHLQSPFGRSPAWVAVDADRVVGFRTYLRWELDHPDGRVRRAARAVDTATHPDYHGRGIFRQLTLHSVECLAAEGVDFVFNTPNAKSRPGYLTMGWSKVGRLPLSMRVTSATAPARLVFSRVPAERWSVATTAGEPAPAVLADDRISCLVDTLDAPSGLRTRRSAAYLRWRYGFERLSYRAIALDDEPTGGIVIFRVRRRGRATEAAICDLLVPGGDRVANRTLLAAVARESGADYVVRVGGPLLEQGYVRVPWQGPMLTWRGVAPHADPPHRSDWQLSLGDIELM